VSPVTISTSPSFQELFPSFSSYGQGRLISKGILCRRPASFFFCGRRKGPSPLSFPPPRGVSRLPVPPTRQRPGSPSPFPFFFFTGRKEGQTVSFFSLLFPFSGSQISCYGRTPACRISSFLLRWFFFSERAGRIWEPVSPPPPSPLPFVLDQ